jgi:hypothetical protein
MRGKHYRAELPVKKRIRIEIRGDVNIDRINLVEMAVSDFGFLESGNKLV